MMLNITDIPERYKKQILEKLEHEQHHATPAPSKYHNNKTIVGNIVFDSKKEADRFNELMTLQNAGKIHGLRLQQCFTLVEGFKTITGNKVRPIRYVADFVYFEDGTMIIEDVKGVKTKDYLIKKKLMQDKGFEITEV